MNAYAPNHLKLHCALFLLKIFHSHGIYFRSISGGKQKKKKDPNATMKRFAIVLVIGLIGFFTLLVIFSRLGRRAADDDPFLDPMANPNIRVAGN